MAALREHSGRLASDGMDTMNPALIDCIMVLVLIAIVVLASIRERRS